MEDGKGKDALRQVIIATHANQRQGNASTKHDLKLQARKEDASTKRFGRKALEISVPFNSAGGYPSVRDPAPITKVNKDKALGNGESSLRSGDCGKYS